jgi:hypothetical protein
VSTINAVIPYIKVEAEIKEEFIPKEDQYPLETRAKNIEIVVICPICSATN